MRGFSASTKARLLDVLHELRPADAVLALVFASVLWLPPLAGSKAYLPALAILFLFAGYTAIRERRLPPIPLFLIVYIGVYVLATLHGGNVGLGSVRQGYFVRPATAVAVATVVTTPRQRLRVVVMIVLFALSQVPIAAVQVLRNFVRDGRLAARTGAVDSVTGSLATPGEPYQGSVLTIVALAAAVIVVSFWLWGRVQTGVAIGLGAPLVALGALTSTRASPLFVLVVGLAFVLAAVALRTPRPLTRRVTAIAVASVTGAVAIVALTLALYAHVYTGISKEWLGAVGHERVDRTSGPVDAVDSHSAARRSLAAFTVPPRRTRSLTRFQSRQYPAPALLPGRIAQLKLAARISVRDGVAVALVGRGPGTSEPTAAFYPSPTAIPPAERTGSTWLGKVLTETGWLGIAVFLGLLAWLMLVGVGLCQRALAMSDRVLGIALIPVAALTGATAAYGTFPTVGGYAIVFWTLVGLAISAWRWQPELSAAAGDSADAPRSRLSWPSTVYRGRFKRAGRHFGFPWFVLFNLIVAGAVAYALAQHIGRSSGTSPGSVVAPAPPRQTYRSTVLADHPVGYWRLGEAGGAKLTDQTSNGNDGTYHGGVSRRQRGALRGASNTAVALNGTSGYATIPNSPSLNPRRSITLEVWVKPKRSRNYTQQIPILLKSYTSHTYPFYQYTLFISDVPQRPKNLTFQVPNYGGLDGVSRNSTGWRYDRWNHIVGTYDGRKARLYVDGVEVGSKRVSGRLSAYRTPLAIGAYDDLKKDWVHCFNGKIDEVAVYSTALSAEDVLRHYRAGLSKSRTASTHNAS